MRWRGIGLVLLGLAALRPAYAIDLGEDLQLHGFLSQGFIKTSDNRFFGDSEDGSFEFTEIGLNASYQAAPGALLSGQLLSRRAGAMYDGSPTVDYALLDWNLSSNPEYAFGVLLGRTKNVLGLYNDTRDAAFTRPSILLPQQIYFDKVRNLVLSSDGVKLYGRLHNGIGNWAATLGAGRVPIDRNVEYTFLARDFDGQLEQQDLTYIASIDYQTHDANWRVRLSGAKGVLEFDAAASDPIGSGEIDFLYWIASAQYNAERWSLTAEFMEEPVDFARFGSLLDARGSTVQGYYLQGAYLMRDDLEGVLRYGAGFTDKDDRDGRRQAAASGGLVPSHNFYQQDWMVGLRWDVTPSFMLRTEYQWSRGTWTLSPRENPDPSATAKRWDMFSILASYRF